MMRVYDVLRWIAVLPAAAAGGYIIWLILSFMYRIGIFLTALDDHDLLSRVWSEIFTHGALGWGFVYAGVFVAPAHRQWVALVLGALGILVTGFLLYPSIMMRDWWAVIGVIAMACGCAGAGYTNYKEYGEINAKRSAKLLAELSGGKPV